MSKDSQKVKENEIRRKMNRRLECEIQRDTYKKFKWLHMRNEAFRLPTSTMESLLSRWHIRKPRKARKFSRKRSAIRDWRQTNFKVSLLHHSRNGIKKYIRYSILFFFYTYKLLTCSILNYCLFLIAILK